MKQVTRRQITFFPALKISNSFGILQRFLFKVYIAAVLLFLYLNTEYRTSPPADIDSYFIAGAKRMH